MYDLTKSQEEALEKVLLSAIPKGKPLDRVFPKGEIHQRILNFTHLLTPIHRRNGYEMHAYRPLPSPYYRLRGEDDPRLMAYDHVIHVFHNKKKVGEVQIVPNAVWHQGEPVGVRSVEFHSKLAQPHRGKGIGFRAYEAAISYARNHLDVKLVSGGEHTADAHRVHEKLAAKYGLKYKGGEPQVYNRWGDNKQWHKPYRYAIKSEQLDALERLVK